jgi:hypothetical protein
LVFTHSKPAASRVWPPAQDAALRLLHSATTIQVTRLKLQHKFVSHKKPHESNCPRYAPELFSGAEATAPSARSAGEVRVTTEAMPKLASNRTAASK